MDGETETILLSLVSNTKDQYVKIRFHYYYFVVAIIVYL